MVIEKQAAIHERKKKTPAEGKGQHPSVPPLSGGQKSFPHNSNDMQIPEGNKRRQSRQPSA